MKTAIAQELNFSYFYIWKMTGYLFFPLVTQSNVVQEGLFFITGVIQHNTQIGLKAILKYFDDEQIIFIQKLFLLT